MHKYEFYTKISNDGIIILPDNINQVRNHTVKIIIFDEEIEKKTSVKELLGAFHKYADETKVQKEKQAIQEELKSKHETNRC
jgi:hypothetical protein